MTMPLAGEVGQQARLREVGDVRRIARIDGDRQSPFEFLVADVVHGDAGGFFERLPSTVRSTRRPDR